MPWIICMGGESCIGIWNQLTYSSQRMDINLGTWMYRKLSVGNLRTRRLERLTTPVLRFGETSLMTPKAIFGHSDASSFKWQRSSLPFKARAWKISSRAYKPDLFRRSPTVTLRNFRSWFRFVSGKSLHKGWRLNSCFTTLIFRDTFGPIK